MIVHAVWRRRSFAQTVPTLVIADKAQAGPEPVDHIVPDAEIGSKRIGKDDGRRLEAIALHPRDQRLQVLVVAARRAHDDFTAGQVVERAAAMAEALGSQLHVGYAVPFSKVLRDLGLLDRRQVQREGEQRAERYRATLEQRGIKVEAIHVATGAPEKVLINLAAENKAGLVVLGTVGRKKLVGRVLGNTAEQILRLLKADVLALKP